MVGIVAALAPAASAATFKVTTVGDGDDTSTGDNVCMASTGGCTLRAAIEQADATAGADEIKFSGSTVRGQTITVLSANGELPDIDEPVRIDGCSSDPSHVGPCVGLHTQTSSMDGLSPVGSDIKVRGLAITNAQIGIVSTSAFASSSPGVTVKNNWLGIKLDGSVEGNGFGVDVVGNNGRIGGATGPERNVFAGNNVGLTIFQGDDNVVQGNRFGTKPDGSAAAANANDENISVTGHDVGSDAVGNAIGGTVTGSAASSKKCDGVCNLIVDAAGDGIDLHGGVGETPAQDTTVAGNFIGLSKGGGSDRGNGSNGIQVGDSLNTTIGGSTSGARNFIAGNESRGIQSQDTTNLEITRNYLSVNSSGTTEIANGDDATIGGGGLFHRNRVGDLVVVQSTNEPTTITHNRFGVGVGGVNLPPSDSALLIDLTTQPVTIGGADPDDANVIGNSDDDGIIIGRSSNIEVLGNYIGTDSGGADRGNAGNGVLITNFATATLTTNNIVGGDDSGESNVISNNGHDAIAISGESSAVSGNIVGRNKGKNNGSGTNDLFVDLVPDDGPGVQATNGPHNAIPAPTITSANSTSASGSGAFPFATVRLYRTKNAAGSQIRRIDGFLGLTIADGSGDWSIPAFLAPVPSGQRITALQSTPSSGNSELATAVAP